MVDELLDNLVLHLKTKGTKSVKSYEFHIKPVRAYFALTRACDLTTMRIQQYIQTRLEVKRTPATVNRETGALRQALHLARKQERFGRIPHIPMLREDNARQGFFERAEFEAVASKLPAPVDDAARFAYLTGWRRGEIVGLAWDCVDRAGAEIRLRTSKNGHGRVLPLSGELAVLMERRWEAREFATSQGVPGLSELVFHRNGQPLVDFRRVWKAACKESNVTGRLFHDLRRTAVRDMVRAGVPQSVAMSISGHRTMSMFMRYNITSGEDQREALRRTENYRKAQPAERKVKTFQPSSLS